MDSYTKRYLRHQLIRCGIGYRAAGRLVEEICEMYKNGRTKYDAAIDVAMLLLIAHGENAEKVAKELRSRIKDEGCRREIENAEAWTQVGFDSDLTEGTREGIRNGKPYWVATLDTQPESLFEDKSTRRLL